MRRKGKATRTPNEARAHEAKARAEKRARKVLGVVADHRTREDHPDARAVPAATPYRWMKRSRAHGETRANGESKAGLARASKAERWTIRAWDGSERWDCRLAPRWRGSRTRWQEMRTTDWE